MNHIAKKLAQRSTQWLLYSVIAVIHIGAVAQAPAAKAPSKGDQVVYRDESGRDWCVTVVALDTGVDSRPWAWVTFNDNPQRLEHAPVDNLGHACSR